MTNSRSPIASQTSPRGPSLPVAKLPPPVLITEAEALRRLVATLEQQPVVAVDTESDSLYAYYYKVCLIQLSTPEADYLVDPLALPDVQELGRLFANPAVQKVFHAAENDIMALKRDYQMTFANIFDTLWAARVLGWANRGLAAILEEKFGVLMDKRTQRTNWGRRPLSAQQLAYARLDSRYLLPLREMQIAELKARGRMTEAEEAFGHLVGVEWEEKPFDPDGFWRLDKGRDLPPRSVAVLRELYLWREETAQQFDWPRFKVLGDAVLVRLAEQQPDNREALVQVRGVSPKMAGRLGRGILGAIARGQQAPIPAPPARRRGNGGPALDKDAQERFERLRAWRNGRAEARGVDPDVVLSNDELKSIALRNPKTMDDLAHAQVLGRWRLETYGDELLGMLRRGGATRSS